MGSHENRTVEKHFFAFPERNAVFLPILVEISLIPVKAPALGKRVSLHPRQRIYPTYTFRQSRTTDANALNFIMIPPVIALAPGEARIVTIRGPSPYPAGVALQ